MLQKKNNMIQKSFYFDKKNAEKITRLSKKLNISESELIRSIVAKQFDEKKDSEIEEQIKQLKDELDGIKSILKSVNSTVKSEKELAQIHSDNTRAFALRDSTKIDIIARTVMEDDRFEGYVKHFRNVAKRWLQEKLSPERIDKLDMKKYLEY